MSDKTRIGNGYRPTRRTFLASGVAAAGLAGLGSALPSQVLAQTESISGNIRFSIWFGPGDIEVWEGVIADFEAANPGVTVNFEPVAWEEYWTKLNTQFASGTAPDVIGIQFQSSVWGPKGHLEPLADYATAEQFASVPDSLLLPCQGETEAGIQQYGLPWRVVGGSLFGNLSAMRLAGINYPAEGWSIDEFVEAAKALTTDEQWGTAAIGGSLSTNLATTFGARPTSVDFSTATYNSPEMLAFKQWQHDLIYKHRAAPAPQDLSTQKDPFTSGTIALLPSASWMYPTYRSVEGFEWDILPDPQGPVPAKTYAGADNVAVYSGSQNKAAAWAFVEHVVFSRQAQEPISATGMPVLIDYLTDPDRIAAEAAKDPSHYGDFVQGVANNSEGWAFVPEFSTIMGYDEDAHDRIMNDPNADIPAILDRTNSLIQEALERGRA